MYMEQKAWLSLSSLIQVDGSLGDTTGGLRKLWEARPGGVELGVRGYVLLGGLVPTRPLLLSVWHFQAA